MQKRKIDWNSRFEWPKADKMKVAGNFYPVTSAIAMRDLKQNRQVTVFTDRAQAGTAGL